MSTRIFFSQNSLLIALMSKWGAGVREVTRMLSDGHSIGDTDKVSVMHAGAGGGCASVSVQLEAAGYTLDGGAASGPTSLWLKCRNVL